MQGLRYMAVSLALGFIATWASENMFWIVPPDGISVPDWLMTWVAYSIGAACALSMVLWSGAGGWAAVFLGGAVLGYLLEGIVVGTIYDAFPFQLVWTPVAWHALITGGLILGGGLAPLSLGRRVLLWLTAGVLFTVWSLFWPLERPVLPGPDGLLVYLALPAVGVAVALWLIGRLGRPEPRRWVLWVAPVLALAVGVIQAVTFPTPLRAVLPVLLLALWWLMRRAGPGPWAARQPLWRHLPVLIVPVMVAFGAPSLWAILESVDVSLPFAVTAGLAGLGLMARIALRGPRG
jgi:hypothetical protein